MSAVWTVARASVTEHVRRRLVLFFLVLALLAGGSLVYASLRPDLRSAAGDVTAGLTAYFAVSLLPALAGLAAVAVSMHNIGRPFDDGEAALILARPVARGQYAAGRLLASAALVAALCLVNALLLQGVNAIVDQDLGVEIWGHWAAQAFNLTLLAALTTLASAVVANPILAAVSSVFAYLGSGAISTLYLLVATGRIGGFAGTVVTVLWYLAPKKLISPFELEELARAGNLGGASDILLLPPAARNLWAVGYLAGVLGLIWLAVRRKEV